jgi:eukaryotic-like serine/threonine-protein kinase
VTAGESDGGLTGQLLGGRYRVTGRLGRGGMGVVCRAVDELLGREVAVKLLRAYTDASAPELADLRARMQREARAAARIRHPGVITVHDVTEHQGRPVIVMELVDGPSLDDVIREHGAVDPRRAAGIGAAVLDALDAAHTARVLHRDVKPANVLLDRSGRVVLTDFGIASIEAPDDGPATRLTRSGEIVGSLDFLPPERAQGHQPGPASDIWSLGMTLYAAVEGYSPFRRSSVWSTLTAIVGEPLPEPVRAGPLAPVLRALTEKDPAARPAAGQARGMLEAVAAGTPLVPGGYGPPAGGFGPPAGSSAPAGSPPPTGRTPPRHRRLALAAAAVLLAGGGGLAYALVDGPDGDRGHHTAAGGTPSRPPGTSPGTPPGTPPGTAAHTPGSHPPSPSRTASPAPSCTPVGAGRYNCHVWQTASSYTLDGTKTGVLHAGTNYFYCQQNLGRRETSGRWTNVWWARTDDDSGHNDVWVSDVYIRGGPNDGPVPGLPVC